MIRRIVPVLLLAALAGCGGGGGGGGSSTPPVVAPSIAPIVPPSPTPAPPTFVAATGTVTQLAANGANTFGSTLVPVSNDGTFIVQSTETPPETFTTTTTLPEYTVTASEAGGQSTSSIARSPMRALLASDGSIARAPRLDPKTMSSPTRLALRRSPFNLGENNGRSPQSIRTSQANVGDTQNFNIDQFVITGASSTCVAPATTSGGYSCYVAKPFQLLAKSTHAYVWLDDDIAANFNSSDMQAVANQFDNDFAIETQAFGPAFFGSGSTQSFTQCDSSHNQISQASNQPVPDLTGADPRISIVITNALSAQGEGGYFSSANLLSDAELQCQKSGLIEKTNGLPMFVIGDNLYKATPGAASMPDDTYWLAQDMPRSLAHEFQHYLHAINKEIAPQLANGTGIGDDAFIDEGCSMLAEDLTTASGTAPSANPAQSLDSRVLSFYFLYAAGNYSLTSFTGYDQDPLSTLTTPPYKFYHNTAGTYGQAYLFMRYIYDRFGISGLHNLYANRTQRASTASANVAPIVAATGESFAQISGEFAAALSASGDTGTTDPRFKFSNNVLLRGTTTFTDPFNVPVFASFQGPRSPDDLSTTTSPSNPRIKLTPGSTVTAKIIQGATLFFNTAAVAGTGATVRATVTGAPVASSQAALVQGAYSDTPGACLSPQPPPARSTCHP